MPIGNVTTSTVDRLMPGIADVYLWDRKTAGFGVRVSRGGTKSYIYQYRLGGRGSVSRRYTIGRHRSPWTAQTARERALRLAKQVEKGKDPVAKRRERRRREIELRFDRYVELFAKNYLKRRWKDWKRIHTMLVCHAVPAIGTKKLSDIKRADLSAIYRRLDNTPSVARSMHATLRKMFNWAMSQDDLTHSPVEGVEAPPPPRARQRYLSKEELRCAWVTSFRLSGQYGPVFRLMMLTGQRRGEVVGLNWSELVRAQKGWILPAERTKNGNSHTVPLSKQAIALLDAVAGGIRWPSTGLVFPSRRGTRLSGFSKIKREWDSSIAKEMLSAGNSAVVTPWRLHDLRRTVATGMQALNVRTEIIEAILNHLSGVMGGLAGVYQCYEYQREKRQAMKMWGRHMRKLTMA